MISWNFLSHFLIEETTEAYLHDFIHMVYPVRSAEEHTVKYNSFEN